MSSTPMLDGRTLKAMLIGGVENIRSNVSEINDLNVFPVPDGDTGTNMTKTLEGGRNWWVRPAMWIDISE